MLLPKGNLLKVAPRGQQARVSGSFDVETDRVLIISDKWDIPHIYAFSKQSAFYTMGCLATENAPESAAAKSRTVSGHGAELLGPRLIVNDYRRRVEKTLELVEERYGSIDPETRLACEAYARGFNDTAPKRAKSKKVPKITAQMIIAAARSPDTNRAHQVCAWEIGYGDMMEAMGPELWDKLDVPVAEPAVIRRPGLNRARTRQAARGASAAYRAAVGFRFSGKNRSAYLDYLLRLGYNSLAPSNGSFCWAVSPEKSASGKALWAGDFAFPSTLETFERHIKCPEYDAAGLSGWGPNLPFGHNRDIVWWRSRTNPDTGDVYMEKVRVDDEGYPTQYLYKGKWLPVDRRIIEIKYKKDEGFGVERLPSFYTRHGALEPFRFDKNKRPAVVERSPNGEYHAYAIRLANLETPQKITPEILTMKARNFDDLKAILKKQHNSIFSTTAVDTNGDMFFFYNAKVPIRRNEPQGEVYRSGHWYPPYRGWTGEGEWTGKFVPFDSLPLHDSRIHGKPDEGFLLSPGAGLNIWVSREDIASYPRGLFEYRSFPGEKMPIQTFTGNG